MARDSRQSENGSSEGKNTMKATTLMTVMGLIGGGSGNVVHLEEWPRLATQTMQGKMVVNLEVHKVLGTLHLDLQSNTALAGRQCNGRTGGRVLQDGGLRGQIESNRGVGHPEDD